MPSAAPSFVFPQLLSFTPCLCVYSTQSSSTLASAASVAFQVYCCFGEMKHFSLIEAARNKDRKLEPGGRGWRGTVRGMTAVMIWCNLTSTDGAEQTKQFKQTTENTRVAASFTGARRSHKHRFPFLSLFLRGCLFLFNPPFLYSRGICGISCQPASPALHHCQNDSDQNRGEGGGSGLRVWLDWCMAKLFPHWTFRLSARLPRKSISPSCRSITGTVEFGDVSYGDPCTLRVPVL